MNSVAWDDKTEITNNSRLSQLWLTSTGQIHETAQLIGSKHTSQQFPQLSNAIEKK